MDAPLNTVGALLAKIAISLQDALRILMFADKRGWGPDEFEQVRAVEDALDEAKRDFQFMARMLNGQFYYENDRRTESLDELLVLSLKFDDHTQTFRDWIRGGGPIDPLWVRETVDLRRQLHRAQCRAARRIFNAEHETGDGAARCLGAFLLYRRLREQEDTAARRKRKKQPANGILPTWKQQQQGLLAREERQFAGQEPFSGRGRQGRPDDTIVIEMMPQDSQRPTLKSALKQPQKSPTTVNAMAINSTPPDPTTAATATRLINSAEPSSQPARPLTLEDLVPDCSTVGTFERFGDRDIAFICDYCDGHIVWEDVQRLPTTRAPPPSLSPSSSSAAGKGGGSLLPTYSTPSTLTPLPQVDADLPPPPPRDRPSPPPPLDDTTDDGYPRWQATTTAASTASDPAAEPRTIVFAPLAIANHLPPLPGGWEARLWCPYCDDYLYYDSAEGDQTRFAQGEHGFETLADFQEHLEWEHTALPLPSPAAAVATAATAATKATGGSCAVM